MWQEELLKEARKINEKKFETYMSQAHEKEVIQQYRGYWRYMFDKNPELLTHYLTGYHKGMMETYLKRKKGCMVKKYVWLTVNPMPGIKLEEFKKCIKKCTQKCWIDRYKYCYETRGLGDGGYKGVHMHMKIWLSETKNYGECKRECYNTFRKIVSDPMKVYVAYSNIDDCYEEYMKGIKNGEKKDNYYHDLEFRKEYGLKDIYEG